MRKFISVLIALSLTFTICGISFAEVSKPVIDQSDDSAIKSTVEKFLNNYYQSLTAPQINNEDSITEDNSNTYAFKMFKKQRADLYQEYDVKYEWVKLAPSYKNININNNKASVEMLIDVDYKLQNVDVESGEYNIKFNFDLKNKSGKWQITSIDSDYILFRNYKENVMAESKTNDYKLITKSAIDKVYKIKSDDIKNMKKLENEKKNNNNQEIVDDQVMAAATYSYSSSNGVSYATRFAGGTTTSVGDLLSTPVESPHNYTNNYNNTWTVSKTGAVSIRVHFSRINTESNWDYVKTDAGDSYTGGTYSSGVWSR